MSPDQSIGPYGGQLAEAWFSPALVAALSDLPRLMVSEEARVLQDLRNRSVCVPLPGPGDVRISVVVKSFGRPSRKTSLRYRQEGSKARRSWQVARILEAQGAGTPRPVGFLERWEGLELVESYFLTEWAGDASSMRDELRAAGNETIPSERTTALVTAVAKAVRKMHDAGLQHNDLGQVNILLRKTEANGTEALFIDLNRARHFKVLSLRRRAKDLSRLHLSFQLRQCFEKSYFHDRAIPARFRFFGFLYRLSFAVWRASRNLRHPLRARRRRLREQAQQ